MRQIRQRKDIHQLPEADLKRYRAAIQRLLDQGGAPLSYASFVDFHKRNCAGVHGTPQFLPWHRAMVLWFEDVLRSDSSTRDVTVPYWNWWEPDPPTDVPDEFSACVAEVNGCQVRNPLYPDDVQRYTPNQRRNLPYPTSANWLWSLANLNTWSAFGGSSEASGFLELFHNDIHYWVGDTMSTVDEAVKDPIFWSHHSYVDYLWAQEQGKPGRDPVGSELDEDLIGLDGKTASVLHISDLGYEYVVTSYALAVERLDQQGAALIELEVNQIPPKYRAARLTFEVLHFPRASSSLRLLWGQTLEEGYGEPRPEQKRQFATSVSLFGAHGLDHEVGAMGSVPEHIFRRAVWLPFEQFEGLMKSGRPTIPLTIVSLGREMKRTHGALQIQGVEIAFLP